MSVYPVGCTTLGWDNLKISSSFPQAWEHGWPLKPKISRRNSQNPDWAPSCNRPKIVWNNTSHLPWLFHVLTLFRIDKTHVKQHESCLKVNPINFFSFSCSCPEQSEERIHLSNKWMSSSRTATCSPCRFIFTRRMPGWGWRKKRQNDGLWSHLR